MKGRAYFLSFLLLAISIAVVLRGGGTSTIRTRDWVVRNTPLSVERFVTKPSPENPLESYPMDIPNLKASAIVCRIMSDGAHDIDVVVINSSRGESFHDPATCFSGQGWAIEEQRQATTTTRTFGDVKVNSLKIRRTDTGVTLSAAYCFRHDERVYGIQSELLRSILLGELFTFKPQEGNMYRFIALDPGMGEAELLEFVGKYLDTAAKMGREPS